jgi:hypothetical protein
MRFAAGALALAVTGLIWQTASAQSLHELAWVRDPMTQFDNESSSLFMVAGLLIGTSALARRMTRERRLQPGNSELPSQTRDAFRTPSL